MAIAKTENGTGEVEAGAVAGALDEWGLSDKVVASGLDTREGVCHTTAAPGAANPLAPLSPSYPRTTTPRCLARKSPWQLPSSKDPLTWNALDFSNVQFHTLPPSLLSTVPHLLAFVDHRLLPKNEHLLLRCDYKEFLELAKLFLGAVLSRQLTQSQLSWQKKV